jgi:hypothetical protein
MVDRHAGSTRRCAVPPLSLLSKKHLQAIGAVVAYWSLLERIVEECLLNAARLDDDANAQALTAHMSIEQRLDALLSLVEASAIAAPLKNGLQQIDTSIRVGPQNKPSLKTERNEIVHSYWTAASKRGGALATTVRARGKLKLSITKKTPTEIEAVAIRIRDLTERLGNWQIKFLAQLARARIATEEASPGRHS